MTIFRLEAASLEGGTAEEIGAKAAILAAVAAAGGPVPPAFVLPISLGAAMTAGDGGAEKRSTKA
jgi:pyruvate,orthophosphate dikinase